MKKAADKVSFITRAEQEILFDSKKVERNILETTVAIVLTWSENVNIIFSVL